MYKILELNPHLASFSGDIDLRMSLYRNTKKRLLSSKKADVFILSVRKLAVIQLCIESAFCQKLFMVSLLSLHSSFGF